MAESSAAGARGGLKPQTNGAPANYELPWSVNNKASLCYCSSEFYKN